MDALIQLAVARFRLKDWSAKNVLQVAPELFKPVPLQSPSDDELAFAQRVAAAVPAVAAHVPWRSDCLVQAVAAQQWLSSVGIHSSISIGVRRSEVAGFEAHAWLTVGDQVVTGGDISSFAALSLPQS